MTPLPLLASFLINPSILAIGAGLAAIPIIIHLLSKRRVRKVRWAAMEWLMNAMKRHQRRLRLENWLILLLRTAAVILLGLAIARPVITDDTLAGLFNSRRTVYLVIDNSYSTEARMDARAVFDRVQHEAELVLDDISSEDVIAVVTTNDPHLDVSAGTRPHVLVGRTVGREGAARAKEAVLELVPRRAPARWAETLALLRKQMEEQDVNRQVIILTDRQARDWVAAERERIEDEDAPAAPLDEPASDDEVGRLEEELLALLRLPSRVQIVDVGAVERRNLGIQEVRDLTSPGAFVGQPVHVEVTVANHGEKLVEGALLEVSVDDRPGLQRVLVPPLPGASTATRVPEPSLATVRIDLPPNTFSEAGSHWLRFKVIPPHADPTSDSLGVDSERLLAMPVRRRIRVFAWTRASETPPRARPLLSPATYLRSIYRGASSDANNREIDPDALFHLEQTDYEAALLARLRNRDRDPLDMVLLANTVPIDPQTLRALRSFVDEGGGLMVFTGDRVPVPSEFNAAFWSEDPEMRLAPYRLMPAEFRKRAGGAAFRPFRFDLREQTRPHPIIERFVTGIISDLLKQQSPAMFGRTPFDVPTQPPESAGDAPDGGGTGADEEAPGEILLRFAPEGEERMGRGAIVAGKRGLGRTLWVGTSLDQGWLEQVEFLFLPFFLRDGAFWLTESPDAGQNLEVGDRIQATLPLGATNPRFGFGPGESMRRGPTRQTPEDLETGTRATVEFDDVGRSGLWRLSYRAPVPGGVEERELHFAVNPDAAEGSLLPAKDRDLRGSIPGELDFEIVSSYADSDDEVQQARSGEMTRYILYIVLAILLLESFLAMHFGKRKSAGDAEKGSA